MAHMKKTVQFYSEADNAVFIYWQKLMQFWCL